MIKLPRVGGLSFVREMLSPATSAFEQEFGGRAFRLAPETLCMPTLPWMAQVRASSACC